jgi:hypothetical protein
MWETKKTIKMTIFSCVLFCYCFVVAAPLIFVVITAIENCETITFEGSHKRFSQKVVAALRECEVKQASFVGFLLTNCTHQSFVKLVTGKTHNAIAVASFVAKFTRNLLSSKYGSEIWFNICANLELVWCCQFS